MTIRSTRPAIATVLLALTLAAPPVARAATATADWPCVQRKVETVSAGTMWAGPPLDEAEASWRDDPEVVDLAARLASRDLPEEEAVAAVDRFAAALPAKDRALRLTRLFVATLDAVNRERADLLAGIGRYGRRQERLAQRIAERAAEIRALDESESARRAELEQAQHWDSRVFEDRQRSLRYLCEQPVLLEHRAFAVARAIQRALD